MHTGGQTACGVHRRPGVSHLVMTCSSQAYLNVKSRKRTRSTNCIAGQDTVLTTRTRAHRQSVIHFCAEKLLTPKGHFEAHSYEVLFAAVRESVAGSAPRRRESSVEE